MATLPFLEKGEIIAAFDSDGQDNTSFAGALADELTLKKAKELNLDPQKYLADNNSYSFFKKVKDYLYTGPLDSNMADFIVALKE